MKTLGSLVLLSMGAALASPQSGGSDVVRYVRYELGGTEAHGILTDDGTVRELDGDPVHGAAATGRTHARDDVRLLAPATPGKVIAIGFNYKSHLDGREPPTEPGIFIKLPSSIIGPGADIVLPPGAANVHYEGELVVVIGKSASRVSPGEAAPYIFGVTAGNDVSERDWQASDLQWFRAKASDTFGPIGPAIVSGLDYENLLLSTRLNGELVQEQRTSDLLFGVHRIVSHVSQFVTLEPGDIIFTGTPGSTRAMQPGDVVEVEVEGVGVLRNTISER